MQFLGDLSQAGCSESNKRKFLHWLGEATLRIPARMEREREGDLYMSAALFLKGTLGQTASWPLACKGTVTVLGRTGVAQVLYTIQYTFLVTQKCFCFFRASQL